MVDFENDLPSPRYALTRFINITGMHGLPNISVARSLQRRITWILLTLGMIGVCLWEVVLAVQMLLSRPVSTSISFVYASPMNFPAVTICNLNPVRYNRLKKYSANRFVQDMLNTVGNQSSGPTTISSISDSGTSWTNRNQKNMRQDYAEASSVFRALSAVDTQTAESMGYPINSMLIDCSFNGRNCVPDHFVRFRNPRYGNCYIFNSGMLSNLTETKPRTVKKSGAQNGLELTLYVDQGDYLPNVITTSGFKVLIQDRTVPPLPESNGYEVTPGFQTSFAMRTTIYERAEAPHGTCLNFTAQQNNQLNHMVDQLPITFPSVEVCLQVCEQLLIITRCGCNTYHNGLTRSSPFSHLNSTTAMRPCNVDDTSQDEICIQQVQKNSSAHCRQTMCKNEECIVVQYDATTSTSLWPAERAFDSLLQCVRNHPDKSFKNNLVNVSADRMRDFIYKNFVKVNIYFETLNIEYIKTEGSYTTLNFICDLGGILGLWLGFSILTFFELIEFIIDVFVGLAYCTKDKKVENKLEDPEKITMNEVQLSPEYKTEYSRPERREELRA